MELVSTIRHDGDGGVLDDLDTVRGAQRWLRQQPGLPAVATASGDLVVDEELRAAVVGVRRAVRALFARVVSPGPPSPADAHRLMPADEALAHLNAAAAREPVAPQLHWPDEGAPVARLLSAEADPRVRLVAALARDAVDFLSGPECERLRACHAPRCVRYFIRSHGRQEWCKPSCGNRARVARHYERTRAADPS
ncbi:ABATE domain-containing protein [Streptomyces sp. NPDC020755]|uniref:CGNR zinc finger domain-containing protein n=1 Tax=unclassified Streptomyces TaxID=2593676 RepID=UPI0022426123|nr:ABATE domain-containing protein [Streptomyces sp. VB1]UZI33656.1 ABATE domain-containing protein [Streptomyces sp. VB1]